MQTLRREHMRRDELVQRAQREGARPHLVGQRRDAELDALASVSLALAVQRLMLPVLLIDDGGEQVRTRLVNKSRTRFRTAGNRNGGSGIGGVCLTLHRRLPNFLAAVRP